LENIEENLAKVPLKDIAQSPLAYALYVVVIVLVGVILGQRFDASTNKTDCSNRIDTLEKQVKAERSEKDEAFKAYIIERSANQQIQKTVDSTAINNIKRNAK
jgi:cell division protein FtsL